MNTEDKFYAYKKLFEILNEDENPKGEDDKIFRRNTKTQITNRDKEYTKLLSHFVNVTRARNILKEIFKWSFYLMLIIALGVLVFITYSLFNKYLSSATIEQISESLPLLITSIVGFVSAIITIPATITKYLFSTTEDENITQIILHTQEHDVSGRQWAMDFKKIIENMDDKVKKENDNSLISNISQLLSNGSSSS